MGNLFLKKQYDYTCFIEDILETQIRLKKLHFQLQNIKKS